MTAALSIPARPRRSERITRLLGRIIGRWGVDADQYHFLLQASLAMDFRSSGPFLRGSNQSDTKNALRTAALLNFMFSAMLAVFFGASGDTFVFCLMTIGYAMTMLSMMILMEFGLVVISPDDFPILAHRPVSSRTFMAVRFSNLMFYILILGLSLGLAPAFFGLLTREARWYFPLLYLPVSLLADVFVAAAVVAVYGLLLRWLNYEKLKDVLAYCQIAFSFLLFVGYQIFPRLLLRHHGADVRVFGRGWGLLFPPLWFANLVELGLGHWNFTTLLSTAIVLVVTLLLLPGLFGAISLNYSDRLGRLMTVSQKSTATAARPRRRWGSRLASFFIRDPEERAFFSFISTMFRKNRRFKMQLFPQFGSMFAILALIALDRENRTHLTPMAASFTAMAFAQGAAGLCALLPYCDEFAGSWIFQVAPIMRQENILHAVKKAAAVFIFLPLMLLYVITFQFFMPRSATIELGIYGFLSGLLLLQIGLFQLRDFPFSRKADKAIQTRQISLFIIIFPLAGIAFVVPLMFSQSPVAILGVLSFLAATNLLLGRFNNRRFARRNLSME